MRKTLGLTVLAVMLACGAASAQQVNVKIGVLSDMSGLYRDIGGPGSIAAAKLAIAEFAKANRMSRSRSSPPTIRTSRTSARGSPVSGSTARAST